MSYQLPYERRCKRCKNILEDDMEDVSFYRGAKDYEQGREMQINNPHHLILRVLPKAHGSGAGIGAIYKSI